MLAPELVHVVERCEAGRPRLNEALLLEVMKAGEGPWCDVFATRFLSAKRTYGPVRSASLDAAREILSDAQRPALGRALAALTLASSDRSLGNEEAAPLLRERSFAVQILSLAAMRRARCLHEQDLLFVLSRQFETRSERHEDDGLAMMDFWIAELRAALAEVGSTETATFLDRRARAWDEGRFVTSTALLQLFAERFGELSLPAIHGRLAEWFESRRWQGVQALTSLRLELALPLLEACCEDPVPRVAVAARELLLHRGMKVPSAARVSVLPQGVLAAPPSEKLMGRLLIAREPELEARKKLRDVLVAEAREGRAGPEEAALLVTLLCDAEVRAGAPGATLRADELVCWMRDLRPFFGPVLERALFSMAKRFRSLSLNAPLEALGELSTRADFDEGVREGLRAHLMALFSESWRDNLNVLKLLGRVGVSAVGLEPVYERLGDDVVFSEAQRVLEKAGPNAALDERLERELGSPLDPEREVRLLGLGIARGSAKAIARALELVRGCSAVDEVGRAQRLVKALVASGAIEEKELLSELERPDNPRFSLAVRVLGDAKSWDAATRLALERAFGSPHPASAADVLWVFLFEGETSPADPRLPQVLARLSLEKRVKALAFLAMKRDMDVTPLASEYVEVLSTEGLDLDYLPTVLANSKAGREILESAKRRTPK